MLKVDIDTWTDTELAIISRVAQPPLLGLVDELYFEYHYAFGDDINFGWGKVPRSHGDVDKALRVFRRLRTLGIRAHFWV